MQFYWQMFRISLLLLFCFMVGGAMVIGEIREKGLALVTFEDIYPGLAAILAGCAVVGLLWFLSRVPKNEVQEPPEHAADYE